MGLPGEGCGSREEAPPLWTALGGQLLHLCFIKAVG